MLRGLLGAVAAVIAATFVSVGVSAASAPTPTRTPHPKAHARPTPTPKPTPVPVTCNPFGDPPATVFAVPIPKCVGGKRLGPSKDSNGTPRYACLYEPAQASSGNILPLVVFLHASGMTADSIQSTGLLRVLAKAQVSDEVDVNGGSLNPNPGFILLVPEGRDISQVFPIAHGHAIGFDYWYRQMSPTGDTTVGGTVYKENVDAATVDQFIADETATGKVDPNAIFVAGWSTGGAFAYLYALSRPNIAAAAPYAAPDPFGSLIDTCQQTPVVNAPAGNTQVQIFNPRLPGYVIHNNCDFAGLCANIEFMETGLLALGVGLQDTIIDSSQKPANGCLASCGTNPNGDPSNRMSNTGARNDGRWPSSWTPAILDFFRIHPLSLRPSP